jgi:acetoacetate decarboxylase
MDEAEVRKTAFAMPLTSPAFPPGPYRIKDVTVKDAWSGPAGLELSHHARAPVASPPVREVLGAVRILSDLTLGLGEVVHHYLA